MNTTLYRAVRCNCGDRGCTAWHVSGVADVHGVSFDEKQALAVADLLNQMELGCALPIADDEGTA